MIKKVFIRILMQKIVKNNMLSTPKAIQLPAMKFIGYSISTTLKNNKQKEDIPPFYHDIYDNNKLASIKPDGDFTMYCIFNMHENNEDFDYYVTVENKTDITDEAYSKIQIPAGKYIQAELLKRNNKTVAMIMLYIRTIWIKANGYKERKAPPFIIYDERFHANFQKYGYRGGDYLGNPNATLYLPVED
ncbi:MAG: GyrI-like domain-containing protein [bacterium]